MKTQHGSFMDIQHIQHMRRKLVCPLHSVSPPGDSHCSTQHILSGRDFHSPSPELSTKTRQVVSIQHQNGRFHTGIQHIDQLSHKFIHLMDLLAVILKRRIFSMPLRKSVYKITSDRGTSTFSISSPPVPCRLHQPASIPPQSPYMYSMR